MKVAKFYEKILQVKGKITSILPLEDLPVDFIKSALYENQGENEAFNKFQEQVDQSEKILFIVPEYNGSFPGVLKAFIDGLRYPGTFEERRCALVGLSAGTQGASLAMSHLTDILNYLGSNVLALKPRLPLIETKIEESQIIDEEYVQLLQMQADALINF